MDVFGDLFCINNLLDTDSDISGNLYDTTYASFVEGYIYSVHTKPLYKIQYSNDCKLILNYHDVFLFYFRS